MKILVKNKSIGEGLVYVVIWLVVFLMPLFLSHSSTGYNWQRITHEWIRFTPYFLIFVLHNFFLFPEFFIKNKRVLYFVFTALSVAIIGIVWVVAGKYLNPQPVQPNLPPPDFFPARPVIQPRIEPWYINLTENVIISVLVIGFNSAIKITAKWQEEEQKNRLLEKENLETELAFLRNQVSPHFFMNTLNNIHALIDVNTGDAKESIVKLSRLMRYLLYDSEKSETTLAKEVEFIKSYVELMKLRVVSNVKISLSFPDKIPEVSIPPLLFISLVENAFKHGISYQAKSFVEIIMKVKEEHLHFRIKNSVHRNTQNFEEGGLGLKNLKKRLELIYNRNFTLETSEDKNSFETNIIIPLYGN